MTTFGFGQSTGQSVQVEVRRASTPGMDEMFTRYWRASVDWKGEEPIRPFG
jgi:hypothetical protein